MIGSLSAIVRSAAILGGSENITRKSLDVIDLDHAVQTQVARTGRTA